MARLSVVVPATDAPATLGHCTAALEASDDPADEVIVVCGPAGLSASAARNAGAARARGDVLVFVDADVVVHPDALGRIRQAFERDPGLTALFGSYDDAPAAPGVVAGFRNLLHHYVHQQGAGPAETFWTGLGAVRRDAFLAAGGFDDARFPHPSVEDIDLGRRLHRTGAALRLDPAVQGTHLKAWTLGSMVRTDLLRRGIPWVSMQVRERRLSGALNLGWRHRLSAAAAATSVLLFVARRRKLATATLAAFGLLNLDFYRLLARRRGPVEALAGVALHVLHHLVAVVAVPLGIVDGLRPAPRPRPVPPAVAAIAA